MPVHCNRSRAAAAAVAELSSLTEAVLIDCPFARDSTPLSNLTSCRHLFASDHHQVKNLEHLATCTALEEPSLIHYTNLSGISALRSLRQLRALYIILTAVREMCAG